LQKRETILGFACILDVAAVEEIVRMAIYCFLTSVEPRFDWELPMESRRSRNRKEIRFQVTGVKPGVPAIACPPLKALEKPAVHGLKAGVTFPAGSGKRS
jgi:hypothetical protein